MPSREPVSVSCQDSWQALDDGLEQKELNTRISANLTLMRDDIQRSATSLNQNPANVFTSGNHRLVCPRAGMADIWLLSDTATTGSTGVDFMLIRLARNGVTQFNLPYIFQCRANNEFPAYSGGIYYGKLALALGDVLTVVPFANGIPVTPLTIANFMVRISLQDA